MRELLLAIKTFPRRDLPWRKTRDPYKILVSELMLQQTQALRVVPFYKKFIKRFPSAKTLAKAKLSDVLKIWSGLGYNRRGSYLKRSAEVLRSGEIYRTPARKTSASLSTEFLESLPGVGPYTARAVAVFAYNRPEVFVETNIRTVLLHHCFPARPGLAQVADADILSLVGEALKKSKMEPRDFYAALMDYGSYLKKQGVKLNSRSRHYTKQSKFEGSPRQKRAAHLRKLLASGASDAELEKTLNS